VIAARTTSPEETKALGAVLASFAAPNDLLVLAGDLGAGKTTLAKGFAAGLGVEETVTSPTFTLVRSYKGRLLLHHVDVYRLERFSELADLGLGELLDGGGVTLVEWGDAVAGALPADYLEVRLSVASDDERSLVLNAVGTSWIGRLPAVRLRLEAWAC
jgi:tRNA threonylcarbamoyladenosine biosynthesis protein TsaE